MVGVPTVGTAVGHIEEWTPQAAVAVPVGNPEQLAGAITRVLADEEWRLHLARASFHRAVLEDADYTAARFESLYGSVTARGSGPRL